MVGTRLVRDERLPARDREPRAPTRSRSRRISSRTPAARSRASPTTSRTCARSESATFFVYHATDFPAADWQPLTSSLSGVRLFAQTPLAGYAKKGGFQGIYTYDTLTYRGAHVRAACARRHTSRVCCARRRSGPGYSAQRATGDTRDRRRASGPRTTRCGTRPLRSGADSSRSRATTSGTRGRRSSPRASARRLRELRRRVGLSTARPPSARTSTARATGSHALSGSASAEPRARATGPKAPRRGLILDGVRARSDRQAAATASERAHDRAAPRHPHLRRALLTSDGGRSWAAALVFGAAAITDQIDGFLARRWRVESTLREDRRPARRPAADRHRRDPALARRPPPWAALLDPAA